MSSAYAAEPEVPAAVSQSEALTLDVQSYRSYLEGKDVNALQQLIGSHAAQQDMVLDFHSNVEIEAEALRQGLDQRKDVAGQLADYRRQVLVAALMRDVRAKVKIPDLNALAKERYKERRKSFVTPEGRKVAHILFRLERGGESKQALYDKAMAVRQQLNDGAEFAELAKEHSDDTTAASGGVLPVAVQQDGKFVKPFEDAAFQLAKVGQISEPVVTQFGLHLIKLLEIEPSQQLSFEDVREQLTAQLREDLIGGAALRARGEAYPDPATINYPALEALVKEMLEERKASASKDEKKAAPESQESVRK